MKLNFDKLNALLEAVKDRIDLLSAQYEQIKHENAKDAWLPVLSREIATLNELDVELEEAVMFCMETGEVPWNQS
jgi:hypothetical protein